MMKLPATKIQSLIVLLAILSAYLLLHLSPIKMYSLQIFALCVSAFLLMKRFKGGKLWHVLPSKLSIEIGLLTFAFVFLIGATGNTHSVFYSLSYVHLFFLVFSTSSTTAITAIVALMLFHFGLEAELGSFEIGSLLSLPVIGVLLLFAKKQYDEVHLKQLLLDEETKLLDEETKLLDKSNQKEQTLEVFINNFLKPKLHFFKKLLEDPSEDKRTVSTQIDLTLTELDKTLGKVATVDNSKT